MKNGIVSIVGAGLLILLAACGAPVRQARKASPLAANPTAFQTATHSATTIPPSPSTTPTALPTAQPTVAVNKSPTASPVSEAFPYLANPLPEGAIGRLGKGILFGTAVSPDGVSIAATSTIGVHMYRLEKSSGEAVEKWFGPTSIALISAAFSPDGKILATGGIGRTDGDSGCNPLTYPIDNGAGGGIQLWDAATGTPLRYYPQTGFITSLAFSPDGKLLASANQYHTVMLWNLETGESGKLDLNIYPEDFSLFRWWVYGMTFSPDGSTLAVGGVAAGGKDSYYPVQIWDWKNGKLTHDLAGHADAVLSLAFSPDGKRLASGSKDGAAIIWNPADGRILLSLAGSGGAINGLAYAPGGGKLASGEEDGSIALWDASSGAPLRTLRGHTRGISTLRYSPDGKTLASVDESPQAIEWDAAAGQALRMYPMAGYSDMTSLSPSPIPNILASGDRNGNILIWDLLRREPILSMQGHSDWVYSVAFSPDGRRLASGSEDRQVILWDASTGDKIYKLDGHTDRVHQVAFSPDGLLLASAGEDHIVNLWDPAIGKRLRSLQGNPGIAFSPDGKMLASMSADGLGIILWNPSSGEAERNFPYVSHKSRVPIVFSPDGKFLAASQGTAVSLFSLVDGMELRQPRVEAWFSQDLALSPDSRIGAVASFTVNLWDIESGEPIRSLAGHTCWARSVAFSPDGKTVYSGSDDGTILIWDLAAILPAS